MSSKKIGHVLLYLFGELIAKGVPFALLPYLTRKLGVEGFGELSYYLSIVAVIMIFISLSQEAATLSYYYKKGVNGLKYLILAGFIINLSMSLLIFLILSFFFDNSLLLITLASLSVIYSLYLATLQAQQKVKQYIFIQIICALLIAILTIFILESNHSNYVKNRIEALILSYFIVSVPFILYLVKKIKNFDFNKLKLYFLYILTYGLPLILHQLGIYFKGQLDRIFIFQQYSKSDLGVYSAGIQVAALLPVFLLAINKAIVPYYYEALKGKKLTVGLIKKYTLYSLPFCWIPALIVGFVPESIFVWLLGGDYAKSKYYIVIYLAGYGLMLPYLLMVNYFFYVGRNLVISKITLTSSLFYVLLLWVFSMNSISTVPYALLLSNIILIPLLWFNLPVCDNRVK